jgi:uncharacterized membrane protein YccC
MFRHSLRLTIAIVFAYLLGFIFDIKTPIDFTVIVIMRPSYGLTKERSKDRIIGTLIGAAVAFGNHAKCSNLWHISTCFFDICICIQQNYKFAAALITISIIFVYSFINPNAFEVIQYRVIDTIIGSTIAVAANYILVPRSL